MRPIDPRHRYAAIAAALEEPKNSLERSLYVALHGADTLNTLTPNRPWAADQVPEPDLEYPLFIFKNIRLRALLEAFLLSTDKVFEISEALAMSPNEISAYKNLFFDTSVFRTELELIVFLQSFPVDSEEVKYYKVAYHQGFGALKWHFCRDKGVVTPENVVKTIMTDAFYRSLEHRGLSITSKTAKEAAKLAKVSLDCARTLMAEATMMDSNPDSLRILFDEVKDNRKLDDFEENSDNMGGMEIIH